MTSPHLVGVLGFQNAGHEWLHSIAIDQLIARLLVVLQSDVSRQLVDFEVLLGVIWHTGSELVWFWFVAAFSLVMPMMSF